MDATLKFHPLAEILPLMDEAGIAELARSMDEHGYDANQPIVLHDGQILDGRNRFLAAVIAGVETTFHTWNGEYGSPAAFVMALNLERRHLNPSQIAMVGARLREVLRDEGKEQSKTNLKHQETADMSETSDTKKNPQKRGKNTVYDRGDQLVPSINEEDKSAAQAAKAVGSSAMSVKRASKVLDQGVPELAAAVDSGQMAVSAAAKVAAQPPEAQRQAVAKVKGPKKTKAVPAEPVELPTLDQLGLPIPPELQQTFADDAIFKEILRLVRQVNDLLQKLGKTVAGIHMTKCLQMASERLRSTPLDDFNRQIKYSRPYASVCPYCRQKPDANCRACFGHGWVPQTTWDAAPRNYREQADKLRRTP